MLRNSGLLSTFAYNLSQTTTVNYLKNDLLLNN